MGYSEMPILSQILAVDGARAEPCAVICHQEPGTYAGTRESGVSTQTFEMYHWHIQCLVSVLSQCSGHAYQKYAEDCGFESGILEL